MFWSLNLFGQLPKQRLHFLYTADRCSLMWLYSLDIVSVITCLICWGCAVNGDLLCFIISIVEKDLIISHTIIRYSCLYIVNTSYSVVEFFVFKPELNSFLASVFDPCEAMHVIDYRDLYCSFQAFDQLILCAVFMML